MASKCIGREQGPWSCRGGGDAVDVDSRGCAAEDAPPLSCRALFALQRELVGAEGRPPRVPHLVGARESDPAGALFGEAPRGKEQARRDRCEPHVVNRAVRADGLLLRVLEAVHVLRDARAVGPPTEHGRQEGDDVSGLEADAAVLEVVEEVAEGGLVIKGQLFLEGEDKRLLDEGFDECTTGAFDGFDKPLKIDIGGPEAFGLGADGIGCVVGDAVVVRLEGGFH